MNKFLKLASATIVALVLTPSLLLAAPNTISYNGKLMGKDGTPLQGVRTIEFSICDQISNGNCPWKEQRSVTFNNGIFSIQLGEITPLPATIFENNGLYLGVALFITASDWEIFSPRQPLTAAPFAMNANDVLKKDISPRSVSVSGIGLVIDATGKWVGTPPTGLQGPVGPQGAPGAAGQTSLISLVDEPAGANCVNGGKKVLVGLDRNSNNSLDADEVSSNAFVCSGVNGIGGVPLSNKSTLAYGWTQTFGSSTSDDVKDLALDAAGNLYVVGNYTGTFDGQQHFGGTDVFVRKYSSQGQLLWTKGIGARVGSAIAVEPQSGGVYIGGSFNGTVSTDFDPDPTKQANIGSTSGNIHQPYILHLDKDGIFVWVKTFSALTSVGEGGVTDLVIDENSNIYYSGTYGSTNPAVSSVSIDFNPDPYVQDIKPTQGRADLFVSKLDKNGYYQWTYLAGEAKNYMAAVRIQVKAGSLYILGKDRKYNNILLTKLNSSTGSKAGEAFWAASNFPYLVPTGIAIDSTGGVVVSAIGSTYKFNTNNKMINDYWLLRNLFGVRHIAPSLSESFSIIQKFDSALNPLWTYTQGVFGNNGVYTVAVDASDNVYFGGEYTGDLVGSESSVYDPRASIGGSTDLNLVKLNSAGKFQWAESIGGYGSDRLQSILIANNDIYLGGFISSGMDGNFTRISRQYISSRGAEDAYVSKYIVGIVTP